MGDTTLNGVALSMRKVPVAIDAIVDSRFARGGRRWYLQTLHKLYVPLVNRRWAGDSCVGGGLTIEGWMLWLRLAGLSRMVGHSSFCDDYHAAI